MAVHRRLGLSAEPPARNWREHGDVRRRLLSDPTTERFRTSCRAGRAHLSMASSAMGCEKSGPISLKRLAGPKRVGDEGRCATCFGAAAIKPSPTGISGVSNVDLAIWKSASVRRYVPRWPVLR